MKKFRTTWIFAILVVGFASYVYYFEYYKKEQAKEQSEEAKKLISVSADQIKELKFVLQNKPLLLRKEEKAWQLVEPVADLADQSTIDSVLHTLTSTQGENVVSGNEVSLNEYGLDSPKGQITVKSEKEEFVFDVGTVTTFANEFYVKPTGEQKVLLVASGFAELLNKPIKDFRDKKIFREKLENPQQLSVLKGSQKVELVQKDGKWSFVGDTSPVSEKEVMAYVQALNDLVAANFVAEDQREKSDYGLASPRFKVLVGDKTLFVSEKTNDKYFVMASWRPQIFEVINWKVEKLFKGLDDFKDKQAPFQFDSEQVKKIRLATAEAELQLDKAAEGWQLTTPQSGRELDSAKVAELVNKVSSLKVQKFLGNEIGQGLRPPKNRLVLVGDDGKSLLELMWGQSFKEKKDSNSGEMYYVKTSKSSETLAVPAESIEGLPVKDLLKENKKESKVETGQNSEEKATNDSPVKSEEEEGSH